MNGFDDLDLREFKVFSTYKYDVIFYQIDLLRLYNILKMVNSLKLAQKVKRIIYFRDIMQDTKTDFKRVLPRSDVDRYLKSPNEFVKYENVLRKLDEDIEEFYNVEDD